MLIKINDDYQVKTDPFNYILQRVIKDEHGKLTVDKEGNTKWKTLGYFGNMKRVFEALLEYDMHDSVEEVSIQEYLVMYKKEVNSLDQLLPEIERKGRE
ncbi:hypothetical protein N6G95_09630 [Pediococcus inopinatus]|uniref:hypothetical protein n=1 Tax=Pediococcus inopinatus TaxID=114090 RepID=UPI002B25C287|nr:hypothetical protein [Pediococcus inopinatus]WPC19463.1 hypothetical protein N6G95_09630 [Pediococcus inopinatus]